MAECNYHKVLESLYDSVWHRIDNHYQWEFFFYWLGDESELDRIYNEVFEEVLGELTPAQGAILGKKGVNLEKAIGKWCGKWTTEHPELPNQNMPKICLSKKIHEHLMYQLSRPDIVEIIGRKC